MSPEARLGASRMSKAICRNTMMSMVFTPQSSTPARPRNSGPGKDGTIASSASSAIGQPPATKSLEATAGPGLIAEGRCGSIKNKSDAGLAFGRAFRDTPATRSIAWWLSLRSGPPRRLQSRGRHQRKRPMAHSRRPALASPHRHVRASSMTAGTGDSNGTQALLVSKPSLP